MESIPNRIQAAEGNEEQRTMGEAETVAFLQVHDVQKLDDWQPGEPVLYVLHERIRAGFGPYQNTPADQIPSLARIDSPTFLEAESEYRPNGMYRLGNDGGKVDYYAIDTKTGRPYLVKTTQKVRGQDRPYEVERNLLFKADDTLFPLS